MKKEITKLQKQFKTDLEDLLCVLYKNNSIPTEKEFYRTVNEDYDEIYIARNKNNMFEYSIVDKDNWVCSISHEDQNNAGLVSIIITYRHGDFFASVPSTVFLDIPLNKKDKALLLMNQVVYGIVLDTNTKKLNYSKAELEKIELFLGEESSKM